MEIERKFLLDLAAWEAVEKPAPTRIVQAYLQRSVEKTIRVRVNGSTGWLTIKGKTTGISRNEFEYEIPLDEANELITLFAEKTIEKFRYEITVGKHRWEVDEFLGKLKGLFIAEIELDSEDEVFERPNWIAKEVSDDERYFNAVLIERC
jgi:adenylate cyclase